MGNDHLPFKSHVVKELLLRSTCGNFSSKSVQVFEISMKYIDSKLSFKFIFGLLIYCRVEIIHLAHLP